MDLVYRRGPQRETRISGLLEVWSEGDTLRGIRGITDVMKQRAAELYDWPSRFSPADEDAMLMDRAKRYAVAHTDSDDVWPWSRHLLTMNPRCVEIPILDPASIAAGIPKLQGVEVPKAQPAKG